MLEAVPRGRDIDFTLNRIDVADDFQAERVLREFDGLGRDFDSAGAFKGIAVVEQKFSIMKSVNRFVQTK